MKIIVLFGLVSMMACRQQSQVVPPGIEINAASMFRELGNQLDFSTAKSIVTRENLEIWMVQFRGDTNRIYANSTRGELLFERRFTGLQSGFIRITKDKESMRMNFSDGTRIISTNGPGFHGGDSFCQREAGETFGKCFQAEADEFCDSFVSCISLGTQPLVSLVIAFSCSCDVKR